ncbi:MAG TPA: hypothetical protein VGD21_05280 [Lysobacter sp.]
MIKPLGRFEDRQAFVDSWNAQASLEPSFGRLNSHYTRLENRPSGFNHLGRFYFGDIIELKDFPDTGYSTLLTKGMSGFVLQAPADCKDKLGIELAWTLKSECISTPAVEALAALADTFIARRVGPHHNEVVEFDFSSIPQQTGLTAFLASHEYWFTDGLEKIPGPVATYIFELFALRASEARLAAKDIDEFSDLMQASEIEPEDLSRQAGL